MATTTRSQRPKKQPKQKRPAKLASLEPAIPPMPIRPFSVDEYLQIVELGILPETPRHELIHGWIIPKISRNPPHDSALLCLQMLLLGIIGKDWLARPQLGLETADSVPEPDIAVVVGPMRRYAEAHPTAEDVGLLVEVAESSLQEDQTTKLRIYASERIPEYWIVNLVARRIEVYTQPRRGRAPTYRQRSDYVAGQEIPVVLQGKKLGTIAVNDILPQ